MFTGIIQAIGKVVDVKRIGGGKEFAVFVSNFLNSVKLGDSIAVDGVCQTVTKIENNTFSFFTSKQTLEITTLTLLKTNDYVNLEKSLRIGDGIDGHLVTGHVEEKGTIREIKKQGEGYLLSVEVGNSSFYIVNKGSIAVDGISLTVYDFKDSIVTISVIPETYNRTTLRFKKVGDYVNIETDILGKYVFNYLKNSIFKESKTEKLSISFLKEHGFYKE